MTGSDKDSPGIYKKRARRANKQEIAEQLQDVGDSVDHEDHTAHFPTNSDDSVCDSKCLPGPINLAILYRGDDAFFGEGAVSTEKLQ